MNASDQAIEYLRQMGKKATDRQLDDGHKMIKARVDSYTKINSDPEICPTCKQPIIAR